MPALSDSQARQWLKAQHYLAGGKLVDAAAALESLLAHVPEHIMARVLLAGTILARGHVRAAAEHLVIAAEVPQVDPDVTCKLALALLRVGELAQARTCVQRLQTLDLTAANLAALAHVCQTLGEHSQALAFIERARALGLSNPDFNYFRGIQLMFNGRNAEADAQFAACLQVQPTFGRAWLSRNRLGVQSADPKRLEQIRLRLTQVQRGSVDHAALEFTQANELETAGDYDNAWHALQRGNAVMHARLPLDAARESVLCDRLIALTPPAFLQPAKVEDDGGPMPIFIIGLPRSGTTLLERILGNHSQVASAGELDDFPHQLRWQADVHDRALLDDMLLDRLAELDYENIGRRYLAQTRWRAGTKRYFVDKLPPNYQLAGLIHRALPHARILHMQRDPLDVCLSNYKALFGDACAYSYDLGALAAHYRDYQRLMHHWHAAMPGRILDVPYASLVIDSERMARTVLEFCGLDFEPNCVDLSRNRAPVATLSTAQVRGAIHSRAVDSWRRYEHQLQPLRAALAAE